MIQLISFASLFEWCQTDQSCQWMPQTLNEFVISEIKQEIHSFLHTHTLGKKSDHFISIIKGLHSKTSFQHPFTSVSLKREGYLRKEQRQIIFQICHVAFTKIYDSYNTYNNNILNKPIGRRNLQDFIWFKKPALQNNSLHIQNISNKRYL